MKKELLNIYCVLLCELKGMELVKLVTSYRGHHCLFCRDKKDHTKYTRMVMRKGVILETEDGLDEMDAKLTTLSMEG